MLSPTTVEDKDQLGYKMLPDDGRLTIRQAWDEFHGPVAEAIKGDKTWPYTDKRKKGYRRRRQFVQLLKAEAARRKQDVAMFVDQISKEKEGRSINSVFIELKKREERMALGKENVHMEAD